MLEARGITFGYAGAEKPLYEGFSFAVEPGERVALAAPSGFGKTTLCRILAGYEKPQAGEVIVDGKPLPERGACPVQLIMQHPEFAVDPRLRMAQTLAEAGGSFAYMDGRRDFSGAALMAQAGEDARNLLDGLGIAQKWLTRFPHELSGGELQRFCVARALAANPRYLIADEMSTMLDAVTQAQIWTFVLDEIEDRNMGLVLVSHSSALTQRLATRVVNLAVC